MSERSVYIIRTITGGPVKIGFSRNVVRRLAALQCGVAQQLTVLRTIPGGLRTEAWMHSRFSHLRIGGEWFSFDDTMLSVEVPAELELPHPSLGFNEEAEESDDLSAPPVSAFIDYVMSILSSHYGPQRRASMLLASDAGCSPRTAENWLRGVSVPQAEKLVQIMVSNVKIADLINDFIASVRGP